MLKSIVTSAATLCASLIAFPATADNFCADHSQAEKIEAFYTENPGAMPMIAARRLGMPEAMVVSGLAAGQSESARGNAFADVWAAMSNWKEATFLIMKGANVFEVKSAIAPGNSSETSQYFNIDYQHPLRGHLRPDQYASIYAIEIPADNNEFMRGVIFFDAEGSSVFSVFFADDVPAPSASEVKKFTAVMDIIKASPSVCSDDDFSSPAVLP